MAQLRTIPLAIAAMGMTVDGREISEKDINDIVESYNYKKYGARINLDHEFNWSGWAAKNLSNLDIKGGMLGDVIELTTSKNEEGIKVLYAVLSPNASFVQLNQADQAVYFSIEIDRDFMKSGQTYLTGLAVTDYPASTYTDRIHFGNKDRINANKAPTDTDLLKVTLALGEPAAPQKSLFGQLFNFNKDNNMKREDFAVAMKDALDEPFKAFTTALNENTAAIASLFAKQDPVPPVDGDSNNNSALPPDDKGAAAYSAIDNKVNSVVESLEALTKTVNDALKNPAADTSSSEEEPQGEEGKYSKLL